MITGWDARQAAGAIAFASAFFITLAAVPLVIRFCIRARILDMPGALKMHSRPVPRLGGIALVLGMAAGAAFATRASEHVALPFFAALAIICAAGIADDVRAISSWLRLAVQFAAAILLWRAGWHLPLAGSGAINLIATCIFVAAFVNAFNFLDGSDGLAAGVAGIMALGFAVLPAGSAGTLGSALAWSAAGAAAAFLLFNFPPARIFMGDSGSTSLGLVIAFLALDFYRAAGPANFAAPENPLQMPQPLLAALLFPVFIAALPLLDTALAIARRLRHGSSPFLGDRRHFYDLLLARGWPQGLVAMASIAVTAALAVLAKMSISMEPAGSLLLFAASVGLLLGMALMLGSLRRNEAGDFSAREGAANRAASSAAPRLRTAK